jgi:hypothetical protein
MGKDNQPKNRQKSRDLQRRVARRQAYERMLIVCEGEKTEPQYLSEICREMRLATAHVHVQHSEFGTSPIQIVEFAEHLFVNGNSYKQIPPRAFDRIYVVFDRDQHGSYHNALAKTDNLDRRLKNDEQKPVPFQAIVSVPCFEMWLLLHFEDVQAAMHRNDVYERLKVYLDGYEKSASGYWGKTKHLLDIATQRAEERAAVTNAHDGVETYTDMWRIVVALQNLKTGC